MAWQPHIKGIKVPAIAHVALDAGSTGVTCAIQGRGKLG
jgi:D-serine deaminase-like pyridoxal phosphate-dependent protein